MFRVSSLVDRYFRSPEGAFSIGGADIGRLADAYGTPLFVYDLGVIDAKWNLLRSALPPEFSIYYSVKANPNRTILRHFLAKAAGLEIASAGEFWQATSAGCSPEDILFAGPGKTDRELEYVLERNIGEIHIESVGEAKRLAAIARKIGIRARIALRVNPQADAEGGAMRMGGRAAAFGVDEERLDETLDVLLACPSLDIGGVHLFSGTQILDHEIILHQYRKGLDIARRVGARLDRPLATVDFGGGFGIPYFAHEQELDTDQLREGLAYMWEVVRRESVFSGTRFIVEPGRYLVGECGLYVTRVVDTKTSRGKKFIIVDGGMNHHLAASGNLGQTIKRNYPIAILNKVDAAEEEEAHIAGPLCTPLDILGRGLKLPRADVGDLIGIFQSGAYARSASPLGFLSHRAPPEVCASSGVHRLVRRRGEFEDYMRDQCLEAAYAR